MIECMRINVTQEEILKGNPFKGLLKMALPLMLLNLINTLYGVVDTYFVGKIGELQVGAVSLVTPIINCFASFAMGLSAAAIAMISRSLGNNDRNRANAIATHSLSLAIFLGIFFSVVSIIFRKTILYWLNTPVDIYSDTLDYLSGISLDYLFLFILTLYQSIRQATGDSKSGARLNIIASILNAILDPLFIFVFKMGVFGAAFATVLSKALMCPLAIYHLVKDDNDISISFSKNKMDFSMMINIIRVSLPASIGQFLASFGFVLMSKEVVSYGSIVMSGYGVGTHISSLFYIPVNGIGSALATFIGQNLGASNTKRARLFYKDSMILVAIICLIVIVAGVSTSRYLVGFFIKNPSIKLVNLSCEYANFSIITSFFMGWFNNLCGVYNGSTNTRISMILSASRILFIRMPIVYLLARYTNLQYTGIWYSMIISNFITCFIGQIIYMTYKWDERYIAV